MELIRNTMPTDLKMIKKFRDGLVLNLKNKNIDENLIFKIRLILDELIINSYEHGNRCEYDKIIDTTFIMDDTCCLIKVKDEGEGIDYLFENDGLHDYHTSVVLAIAKLLSKNKEKLKGDVVFIFQKSEEITTGAKEYLDKGLFEKVKIDKILGLHNWPEINYGKVVLKKGPLMSTKVNFKIEIIGKGQHGSMPHLNIDPIVCASNIVMALQTIISRNTNPFDSTVLSVNSINGGSENNLVVDRAHLSATIRSLSKKSLEKSIKRMEEIVKNMACAYECKYEIKYTEKIPLVYNPEKMYEKVLKSAEKILGEENIIKEGQTMASEDFAFYMEKVPGFFYWFGSGEENHKKEALHSKNFYCSDKAIKPAVEVIANAVLDLQK